MILRTAKVVTVRNQNSSRWNMVLAEGALQKDIHKKSNKRLNQILHKENVLKNRFISNYFMLVHLDPQIRSQKLFSRCEVCTHKSSFCRSL